MRKDSDKIRGMFNDIAPRYDLLNHVLSMGIDRSWRRVTVKEVKALAPKKVLDIATGTGDLAIALARKIRECNITGADLTPNMLKVAERKMAKRGLSERIELIECSALDMPFADESYDAVTVGFGVRNFENLEKGLSEMVRVVRRGGSVFILEFSKPRNTLISVPYLFYFRNVLPLIGRMVSKSAGAYSYLPDSVLTFPCGDDFLRVMEGVGLEECYKRELSFGIATLYIGKKK